MAINKKIAELKRTLAALEARKVKLMELACKQSVNSEPRSYKDYRAAGANVNNFRSFSIRPPMSSTTRPTTILLALQ